MRRPSFGFCWLVATFAAAGGGYWWLQQPFWFEQPEPAASRSHSEYCLRLASRCDGEPRQAALGKAIELAVAVGRQHGDWDVLRRLLESMHAQGLELDVLATATVSPGRAWLLGAGADRRGRAAQPMGVLLRNPSAEAADVALVWAAEGDVVATTAVHGSEPVALAFVDNRASQTVRLDPGACVLVGVETAATERLVLVSVTATPSPR